MVEQNVAHANLLEDSAGILRLEPMKARVVDGVVLRIPQMFAVLGLEFDQVRQRQGTLD